jgi:hypothetical protein
MKSHNGMRPQDIVILLKIIINQNDNWQYRDLSADLRISVSEISESLYRSHIAGLIDDSRRIVHRQSLMEFIEYGLRYVFPQLPGTMVTGIPTAHSHPFFKKHFISEIEYVWPDENGTQRGLSITPLHSGVPEAAKKDEQLYKWLAAIDIIRVGRVREIKFALNILKKEILNESHRKPVKNKGRL